MYKQNLVSIARGMLLISIATGWVCHARAADSKEASTYLRIRRDEKKQPICVETSVVRYSKRLENSQECFVDLVAAVHVAEKSYYNELNKMFRDYDAVLYELVAPEHANVPQAGQRSAHPVSLLQVAMKNMLELEFQLDSVDYQRPNFVHADLSPDEFHDSMVSRDESFTKLFFRLMGQGMAEQAKDPARSNDLAVFSAVFAKDRAVELKRAMATQFENMEKSTAVLDGPQGSTIITERNKRALAVLNDQMKDGKKRLAIFYGAAHLPDFDRKLTGEMKFTRQSERWMEAWDLRSTPGGKPVGKGKGK